MNHDCIFCYVPSSPAVGRHGGAILAAGEKYGRNWELRDHLKRPQSRKGPGSMQQFLLIQGFGVHRKALGEQPSLCDFGSAQLLSATMAFNPQAPTNKHG